MLPLTIDKMNKFVCFFCHSLPNRTLPFFCTPIMILYCTYQMHLTCRNTTERLRNSFSRRTDHREDLSCHCHQFLSLFCEEIACGGVWVGVGNNLLRRFTQNETGSTVYIHTYSMSHYSILLHVVHDVHTCTCSTCTEKQWLPLGLVFDSMLSEWFISQCFDLLQLLDLSLVRAWIWHTLPIITWLRYIPCFFFFQFSFWNDFFFFNVSSITVLIWLFYTHE